ncbi:Dihydrouridine synthase (Dus) [Salinibacillus kushneri]|uniref:Dihydrouridine synthase (Dus) n=1 Tax=Salinibacillus kushneri TaxID=237682 RepID=A0A1I0JL99_9BACI|nr:Dihydrouridine synthase (Dus) [Salinibacillus kushneri]
MFKIGHIEIPNRVVLAPMAGVCNSAFRLTVKEFGAGLVCADWSGCIRKSLDYLSYCEILGNRRADRRSNTNTKIEVCKLHMDRLIALKGKKIAIMEMRKHAAWYLKGLKGNGKVRKRINECDTKEGLIQFLEDYTNELEARVLAS